METEGVQKRIIPLFTVNMPKEVDAPLLDVLHSGYIGQGKKVDEFEKLLGDYIGNSNVLTLNSGTSGLQLALMLSNVGYGDEVISTPMTCVSYLSPLVMEDGSTETIGSIVNQKKRVKVLSWNIELNKFEYRMITNWVKIESPNDWYWLSSEHARGSRSFDKRRGVWVTGDHDVLTSVGYVKVRDLTKKHKIAINDITFSDKQKEFLDACLLGDGYIKNDIDKHGKSKKSRFGIMHTKSQEGWLLLKKDALGSFSSAIRYKKAYKHSKECVVIETKKSIELNYMKNRWYKGKKIVPKDIKLTPLTLATWYMDDGSMQENRIVLCTDCFKIGEVEMLVNKLSEIGLIATIQKSHKTKNRIHISNGGNKHDSARKFYELIAPYVPDCMQYKLPEEYKGRFDKTLWDLGDVTIFYDTPVVIKKTPPKYHKLGHVYCVEVEGNHNFVTNDIILKNCTATNMPILACGAKIVWADIDSETGLIDPLDIERKITNKTKAIIVVDWGGTPCDLDAIMAIGKKYGLKVIEDCAHAFGAKYKGNKVGTICDFTMFSFQAIKHITTVDGGALFCLNTDDYKKGKLLRWYGIDREGERKDFRCEENIIQWGLKLHMNDVCATIGISQMPHAEKIIARHIDNAKFYRNNIDKSYYKICADESSESSYWLFTILLPNESERLEFMRFMTEKGIMVSQVHARNDLHTTFKDFSVNLPSVAKFVERQVSIPVHFKLTDGDRKYIVDCCNMFAKLKK